MTLPADDRLKTLTDELIGEAFCADCVQRNQVRPGITTLAPSTRHIMSRPIDIWMAISANIKERLDNCDGFWRSCSGCYEMEDGQNIHGYPHSTVFGCILGGGCSECGGIGAIWDTTDYAAMGEELSKELHAPPQRKEQT